MRTIIWKGIFYNSLEYFQLTEVGKTFQVQSAIIGTYESNAYKVEYNLAIDEEWKMLKFDIQFEVNNNKKRITGEKSGNEWKIDRKYNPPFSHFDFIDISLTPFTNTLPIRNLQLKNGQEKEISVIYIDILNDSIKPLKQQYRKNTDTNYNFQTIPNDFEANIDVDEFGLVTYYPKLFERFTII